MKYGSGDIRQHFGRRFSLSDDGLRRFDIYERLLRKWQKTINLISGRTLDEVWRRHFWDSAQLFEFGQGRASWLDFGSGGGFPGLALGILLAEQGNGSIQLVESDQRKCAFLREVSRETAIPATVHNCRIEMSGPLIEGEIDVVTARALASLPILLGYAQEYLENGAICLFPKGQDVGAELTQIPMDSRVQIELMPSETDQSARIVVVRRA